MVPSSSKHWADVYRGKSVDQVSWFQPTAAASLEALARAGASNTASLIDIGGGASTLVDDLQDLGWTDLSVMNLSAEALDVAKARLGDRAARVTWTVGDVTTWRPRRTYDVWHDRAVFHFLEVVEARSAYKAAAQSALSHEGVLIIATFAPDGPTQCSGLPVVRYGVAELQQEFGPQFVLIDSAEEDHRTPAGTVQPFTWATFRRQR
jgi:hypothetical protein